MKTLLLVVVALSLGGCYPSNDKTPDKSPAKKKTTFLGPLHYSPVAVTGPFHPMVAFVMPTH